MILIALAAIGIACVQIAVTILGAGILNAILERIGPKPPTQSSVLSTQSSSKPENLKPDNL